MKKLSATAVIAITMSSATAAFADGGDPPESVVGGPTRPAATERTTQWYGWQTLATDLLVLVVGGASTVKTGGYAIFPTAALFGAATPVIHGLHGHNERGLGSAALRFGSMGLVAAAVSYGGLSDAGVLVALAGLGGIVAAPIVDTAIAFDEREAEAPASTPSVSRAASWTPLAAPARDGAIVGASGAF